MQILAFTGAITFELFYCKEHWYGLVSIKTPWRVLVIAGYDMGCQ